jgi:CBS domain-containing membrane protein
MASTTRPAWIACVLAAGGAAAMSAAAWVTGLPLVVASLGPSLLLAAAAPDARESDAATLAIGHGIAVIVTVATLAVFGLTDAPSALVAGVGLARMAAVPVALGLTLAGMLIAGRLHSPAGATALLVALGIVRPGSEVVLLAVTIAYVAGIVALFPRAAARLGRAAGGRARRDRRRHPSRR